MPFDGIGFDPVIGTLRIAEDIILRRGWSKGSGGTYGGDRCVVSAIMEAAVAVDAVNSQKIAWDAGHCYGTAIGVISVPHWNAAHDRTLQDVLDGFDLAVKRRIELQAAAGEVCSA